MVVNLPQYAVLQLGGTKYIPPTVTDSDCSYPEIESPFTPSSSSTTPFKFTSPGGSSSSSPFATPSSGCRSLQFASPASSTTHSPNLTAAAADRLAEAAAAVASSGFTENISLFDDHIHEHSWGGS